MRLTVTNLSATDPVDIPHPFNVTIAASGTKTLGVDAADFQANDSKGNPVWKQWDYLLKNKLISVATLADVGVATLSILRLIRGNILDDNLTVTGDATIGDDLTVTDDAAIGGDVAVTGDITAAGGFRKDIGPFVRDNVAANLTDSRAAVGATAAPQLDIAMTRAGSLMGIAASFTVAPAGTDLTISVFKNGVLLNALTILTVAAGATLGRSATFAKDLYTFVAGDRLGVALTTGAGWTATTSDLAVTLEVED